LAASLQAAVEAWEEAALYTADCTAKLYFLAGYLAAKRE
jgi:hypothetical protein